MDGGEWAPLFTFPELQQLPRRRKKRRQLRADRQGQNRGRSSGHSDRHSRNTLFSISAETEAGIFTILLSLVTCGLWGIITLIQGIMMLTMSQEEFEHKYVLSPSKFPDLLRIQYLINVFGAIIRYEMMALKCIMQNCQSESNCELIASWPPTSHTGHCHCTMFSESISLGRREHPTRPHSNRGPDMKIDILIKSVTELNTHLAAT